jgi:hypothetical protein
MTTLLHIIAIIAVAVFAYLSHFFAVMAGEQKISGMAEVQYPQVWAIIFLCVTVGLAVRL